MSVQTAFAAAVHTPALQLYVYWDGVTATDESARVTSADGSESMDDIGYPHARTATIVLDNGDGRYTPGNTSSALYVWTTVVGQKAELYLGYDVTGSGDYSLVGTYRIRDIAATYDDRSATLTLTDVVDDIAEMPVGMTASANTALGTVAATLLANAGVDPSTYSIDAAIAGTATFAYANASTLLPELHQVAIAEGGRVYVDASGVLQVQSRSARQAALRTSSATIRASEVVYRSATRRKSDRVNRVSFRFEDRSLATVAEDIFVLSAPIKVDAGGTIITGYDRGDYGGTEYTGYYDGATPPVWHPPTKDGQSINLVTDTAYMSGAANLVIRPDDRITWKSNVGIDYSSLSVAGTAYTAANRTGTLIPLAEGADMPGYPDLSVYYHVFYPGDAYGWRGDNLQVTFLNNVSGTAIYVTDFTIGAKPLRSTGEYGITVTDVAAVEANGGRVVERSVSSTYMADQASARARAQELLDILSASRTAIDIPDIDGVPFLGVGDAFTFVDDTSGADVSYDVQVLENRWTFRPESGYTAAITTMPAIGSGERTASSTTTAPAGTATTSTRTGPFRWGPNGTALYWSEATWG